MTLTDKVYWYEAVVTIGSDALQKYLFKSPHLYEVGDFILKRYAGGAKVRLVITYPYGTACPEHILRQKSSRSTWPPVLSEI